MREMNEEKELSAAEQRFDGKKGTFFLTMKKEETLFQKKYFISKCTRTPVVYRDEELERPFAFIFTYLPIWGMSRLLSYYSWYSSTVNNYQTLMASAQLFSFIILWYGRLCWTLVYEK